MTPKEIRWVRIQLGVSVEEFATLLGTDERTIWEWEGGIGGPTPSQQRTANAILKNYRAERARSTEQVPAGSRG